MQKYKYILFFSLFISLSAFSQSKPDTLIFMQASAIDGDTLILKELPVFEYIYYTKPTFTTRRAERRYTRLVRDIKKVYPYAKEAGKKLESYAPILDSLEENHKEQKFYFERIEDELMTQYGDELKKLNTRQGKVLIKLIDRECDQSSYEILRNFRGSFSAFFWQGIARIWGYNLKNEYEEDGEDRHMEIIVSAIENGQL